MWLLQKFQTTPSVVPDAGIATAANLAVIQEAGFHYVAVSPNRPQETPQAGLLVIRENVWIVLASGNSL